MRHLLIAAAVFAVSTWLTGPSPLMADDTPPGGDPNPSQKIHQENAVCLGCHSAAGQASTGVELSKRQRALLADLLLDPEQLGQSVHAELSCKDCHGDGADVVPHRKSLRTDVESCPTCHRRQNAVIVPEFKRSVHFMSAPATFTCSSCHDPHSLRKAATLGAERNIAHRDNSMCLGCHNSDERYGAFTDKKRPDLLQVHAWQPNPQLHWGAVRCIDCHTPEKAGGVIAHDILPKEKAARLCVDCHSTNSSLLTRLYRHEVEEQRISAAGFINAYILTEAYVLGVTRNAYLDWASLIGLLALLGGLSGHALLRVATRSKRQGRK